MNDFDYIKAQFDKDGVETPESLSAENMRRLIGAETDAAAGTQPAAEETPVSEGTWERIAHEPRRVFWRRQLRYAVALAACLLVALVAIPSARRLMNGDAGRSAGNDSETASTDETWELRTFKDEKELRAAIDRVDSIDWKWPSLFNGSKDELALTEEYKEYEAADGDSANAVTNSATGTGQHADTYKQIEGVDEADILKTDGKYIYHVNGDEEIDILRAQDGKTEKVATISRFEEDGYIDSMYLDGDRLVSIGRSMKDGDEKCEIVVYDITDRSAPEEVGHFDQSGSIVSSRMTDGVVYLISRDYADYRHLRPYATKGEDYAKVDIGDIAAFPNFSDTSYAVISAVDCRSGEKLSGVTKAILGVADNVYCNQKHLYLACSDYSADQTVTRILKADLNHGELELAATGKVRGAVYGQFAMDEQKENFRIATTSQRGSDTVNNLFILNKDLDVRGSVTGFARGEEIKAVRFIGERAYVITYEQTDPLFILNISDPDDPKIDGEVKISGFSSLLVPLEGDRLIGIGYMDGNMGADEGVKLALFDVSDPSHPRVLDAKEFKNIESDAQYDHHALLQNKEDGYLAIPYTKRDWDDYVIVEDAEAPEDGDSYDPGTEPGGGVLVFTADGDQIDVLRDHKEKQGISRCTYIDDYIYAVRADDSIGCFELY